MSEAKTKTIELDEEATVLLEAVRGRLAVKWGVKEVSERETVRMALEVLGSDGLPEELAPAAPGPGLN